MNITENMCWKLGVKFLFLKGEILEEEYSYIYDMNSLNEGSKISIELYNKIHDALYLTPEMVAGLIKMETRFLIDGEISNKRLWITYLFECLHDGKIDADKYKKYREAIDFDTPITESERYIINEILDYVRIKGIKNEPSLVEYISNPSFNVLMAANNL